KAFFFLDSSGFVRRVNFPELREQVRADIGHKCSWLSLSKEGLLLTVADRQQVWLLDPETLKVKSRFEVAGVRRAGVAPSTGTAIAAAADTITTIDLKTGSAGREYKSRDFSAKFGIGFAMPTVSPDGKYLFTMGGIEQLHRFRIDDTRLVHEQVSPRIAQ